MIIQFEPMKGDRALGDDYEEFAKFLILPCDSMVYCPRQASPYL